MTRQDQMYKLVAEQEQSGQSIVSFCAAQNLKSAVFHYWRRKYWEESAVLKGFISISPPVKVDIPDLRLVYPNGVSIQLPIIDLALIAQLINLV